MNVIQLSAVSSYRSQLLVDAFQSGHDQRNQEECLNTSTHFGASAGCQNGILRKTGKHRQYELMVCVIFAKKLVGWSVKAMGRACSTYGR